MNVLAAMLCPPWSGTVNLGRLQTDDAVPEIRRNNFDQSLRIPCQPFQNFSYPKRTLLLISSTRYDCSASIKSTLMLHIGHPL